MANDQRGQWGTRAGFILAAAGSAVGLGNIWKFPYITGENGGGLFVLIYLFCIALVGLPILMAEIMIGRAAQKQPVAAFHALQGKRTVWAGIGWMGVVAGFIILSYYIVVAGWAMDFTLKSVVNFTKPIHEQAELEATKYRATASIDDMRLALVDRMAEKNVKNPEALIRRRAKPSVWKAWAQYDAAVNAADSEPAKTEARRRLRLDPEMSEQIDIAQPLHDEIQAAKATERAQAEDHYNALSEEEILDEAEDLFRRNHIFSKVDETFGSIATDGWTSTLWSALIMFITIIIVSRGIARGIEAACRVLMPALLILIGVMVVYGMFKPGFGEAMSFVFKPDVSKLKPSGVLEALGHAFFTLSLGMGAMITYGSYQKAKGQLAGQSVMIAGLDTAIALLACMMIFPIVFSYGQDAQAGPGLVFKSMPLAFAEIGSGGMLLAILFFGLLVFAALTSAISLLEVISSYFIDELGWTRRRAVWLLGSIVLVIGVFSAFALDPQFALVGWEPSFGMNFFDTADYLVTNWMLPIGGLFIAIYAGWVMPARMRDAELTDMNPTLAMGWLMLVRFIAPALVIIVLAQKVGILNADEVFHFLLN